MTSTTTSTLDRPPPALANGTLPSISTDFMSVSEIKEQAKSNVQRIKGASVLSLLKAAKEQSTTASLQENAGDLKSALRAYIMATSLLYMIYDSTEYKAESNDVKKRGVFWKEFKDFNAHFMTTVIPRTQKLETRLKEFEQTHQPSENGDANGTAELSDGPNRKPGGSIADRMRSLQDHGLSVEVSKRFSRDLSTIGPISPRTTARPPPLIPKLPLSNTPSLTSPPPTQSSHPVSSPPLPPSTLSSPHAFVSTASFGPPSPTSSAGSLPELPRSPRTFDFSASASTATSPSASSRHALHPTRTESEFANAFPSIDELNEQLDAFPSVPTDRPSSPAFPSVPTTKPGRNSLPPPPSSARDLRGSSSPASRHNTGTSASSAIPPPYPPPASSHPLPPTVERGQQPQRPASTPIPPTNSGVSQPTSPSERSPTTRPYRELPQPPVPPVTSSPVNPNYVTRTPARYVNGGGSPNHDVNGSVGKFDLPVTSTIYPHVLNEYQNRPGLKVLLLDIRTRAEFDAERIRGDEVVCLEPSILTREKTTSASIESALIVSPSSERALFVNRAKFDLVVMYDVASTAPSSPISGLVRAIFETEFVRSLKRPPVLLVGGIEAWKREFGDQGIVKGTAVVSSHEIMGNGVKGEDPDAVTGTVASDLSVVNAQTNPHARWVPSSRPRAGTHDAIISGTKERPRAFYAAPPSLTSSPPPSQDSPDIDPARRLVRRPALVRPPSSGQMSAMFSRTLSDNITGQHMPQSALGLSQTQPQGSIYYPSTTPSNASPYPSSSLMGSSSSSSLASTSSFRASTNDGIVSPPPLASINPSPLSRRRSDYIDQAQQAYSGVTRPSIDYPDLSAQHVLRPPPAAASSALERHDHRPRAAQHGHSFSLSSPTAPTIQSDYPVIFWADVQIGASGLKNLGNTCYMNSTIQCLSATVPFARFFTDGRWKNAVNMLNPLGSKGNMAKAFATVLHELWHGDLPYLVPYTFRKSVCIFAPQFGGSDQHDSQEFLSFLLDGLHEDLNRVLQKPQIETTPDREAQLETLPQQIASEQEWKTYRMRNDSIVVDYFQGQFRNRLQCLTCHKTSTTYNPFMYLSLPLPSGRSTKTTLYQCLDAFVKEEILEKSEAWNCPNCKALRKASKQLSLSRLPPVIMIHLKRFSFKGPFTDKLETLVDFPLKDLDLTNYLPAPLPPGLDSARVNGITSSEDPRTQLPPYKYHLYGVTNHFGSLSSGHYTAFVASRGGWLYCDDSRVTNADSREIVGRPAYVLYYKRVKTR